ncbi:MAG: hypothetical protein HC938_17740 [Nitrospira sp.]|nr:hypothetical protein [Nitrospira sp.]
MSGTWPSTALTRTFRENFPSPPSVFAVPMIAPPPVSAWANCGIMKAKMSVPF